jgi:hypothetical protein
MADHDPLCPWETEDWRGNSRRCYCALITRVRESQDEVSYANGFRAGSAEVRERIAQEIEADHATGPLCKAFGGGANVCTHGRDAAIARGGAQ